MPLDLSTYMARLRSPPYSMSRNKIQVSISDETETSVCSSEVPAAVRLVNKPVIWWSFIKSTSRINKAFTSSSLLPLTKLFKGSTTTTCGLKVLMAFCISDRCISRPYMLGREQ